MRARRMLPVMVVVAPLCAVAAEDTGGAIEEFGFFDYLGEMVEDDDGEWVDPLAMETLAEDAAEQSEDDEGRPVAASGEEDDE